MPQPFPRVTRPAGLEGFMSKFSTRPVIWITGKS